MTISSPSRPYLDGKKLNKIEQNKAAKDGLLVGSEIEKFAELGWEQVDETDLQLRLKWYGMFWRPKTPGKFMLRLRVPNGVLTADQLRVVGSIVERYGENGSCDITTRQNLQLRGVLLRPAGNPQAAEGSRPQHDPIRLRQPPQRHRQPHRRH